MSPSLLLCLSFAGSLAFQTGTPILGQRQQAPLHLSKLAKGAQINVADRHISMLEGDMQALSIAAVALLGIGVGIGALAYIENQGEGSQARGAVSKNLQTKLEGTMLEDVEIEDDLDDLISALETAALTEEQKAAKEEEEAKAKAAPSDGW